MAFPAPPLLLLLLSLHFFSLSLASSFSPPPGNSLALRSKTLNAHQFYRCVDGEWLPRSAYATLVDFYNSNTVVGSYVLVRNSSAPKYMGTWTLLNSAGDQAESGFSNSTVSAKQIAKAAPASALDLPDFLALASMHQYEGAASQVSYVARINSKGGVPVNSGYCEWNNKFIKLPFEAEFHFWKQDVVPPSTPNALAVSSSRPIQGFFGSGIMSYLYDGKQWKLKNVAAKMYDVPGGTQVGAYFTRSVPDYQGGSFCWQVFNPNGFELVSKQASPPVQVAQGSLPWSLNVVTSSSNGTTPMFGPYAYVQTVSTTGGLPPSQPAWTPKVGQVWKAAFTAIYWFYCKL